MTTGILDVFTIILHEPKQNVPAPGDAFGSTALVLPVPREQGKLEIQNLAVTTETMLRLDSSQSPCLTEDEDDGTLLDCIDNVFEQREDCFLPWRLANAVNRSGDNICNETELITYKKYMIEMMGMASIENLYEAIGCTLSCNQTVSKKTKLICQ